MSAITISRWDELMAGSEGARLAAEIERIFFAASNTQDFPSAEAKAAFRMRWLGRYLAHFSEQALVARAESGRAVGYAVGSLGDPAQDPMFSDLAFLAHFRALTARYPAQLHVNVDAAWRGRGIGARLVGVFCDEASAAGAPGVHVVTQRGLRNVGFYQANGFIERGAAVVDGRELLFLARDF